MPARHLPETLEVLRSRLDQQDYYAATALLTNFLRRWGYAQAVELFRQVGGNGLAPGIWQAAIASLGNGPEATIIAEALDGSLGCHLVTVAAGLRTPAFGAQMIQARSSQAQPAGSFASVYPPYTYSVGLWHNFWHPELIVVGLPAPVALRVLKFYAAQISRGKPPQTDRPLAEGITGDTSIQFKLCVAAAKAEYLHWASWFNGTLDYPALQLVWQDADCRWPWEPGFSPRRAQPLLC